MQRTYIIIFIYNNNTSLFLSSRFSLMAALQYLIFLFFFFFFFFLLLQNATSVSPLPLSRRPIHSNFAKHPRRIPMVFPVNRSSCDLFSGEWVRDETYPLYNAEECGGGMIDPGFDCQTYGRPDSDYLKFRWKPFNCDVPRSVKTHSLATSLDQYIDLVKLIGYNLTLIHLLLRNIDIDVII